MDNLENRLVEEWRTRFGRPPRKVAVPTGARVVGVATEWENSWTPKDAWKLVAIEPDGRTLSFCDSEGYYPIVRANSPIVHATVAQEGLPLIAYTTEAGEVVVYSLSQNTALYRLQTEPDTRSGLNLIGERENRVD